MIQFRQYFLSFGMATIALLGCAAPALAQDVKCYPMLLDLSPLAAQVGTTSTHTLSARYNLAGAYQVLVTGRGVEGHAVLPEDKTVTTATKIAVKFDVAADALPGVRDFRLGTPQGVSTLGQLVITRWPVVVEQPKNDTIQTAQKIELPAAVCGVVEKAEDVDFYRFKVEAGKTLSFAVRAARCEDRIHDLQTHIDPMIVLRNEQGTTLSLADNYFFADPLMCHRFERAGEYTLEIRDVRYQGNASWQYVIEISDAPLVTNVFPLAVNANATSTVELLGCNLPSPANATVALPADAVDGPTWASATDAQGKSLGPVPVVVSHLPLTNVAGKPHDPAAAMPIAAPMGVNGRIAAPGQADFFVFEAKKGETFSFEVFARRHESALDPVLSIINDKGARILEADDSTLHRWTHGDATIENWAAPAHGRYVLELRDVLDGGGPNYVYFLSAVRSQPYFTLHIDTDKVVLAPGTSAALFVRTYRKNGFAGEIQLAIDGLPEGVTAVAGRILAGENDGCIVLHAADDAKQQVQNISVRGSAKNGDAADAPPLTATALPWQETYLPGGGRGLYAVEMLTLSVGAPLDVLRVTAKPAVIKLKPGESQKIEVTIERAPEFKKNVSLDCMYRHLGGVSGNSLPPGVTIDEKASKTLLTGAQTTGVIVLTAAKDAKPVDDQIVPLMAHVSINFVMKMSYAAEPLHVTVEK